MLKLKNISLFFGMLILISCHQNNEIEITKGLKMNKIKDGSGKSFSDPLNYYYYSAKVYDKNDREIKGNEFQPSFFHVTQVEMPRYSYDFVKALNLLRVGDSVYFSFLPDSFFLHYYGITLPSSIKRDEPIHLHLKMLNIMNQEEYDLKMEQSKEELKNKAFQEFDKYLRDNTINENPIGKGTVIVKSKTTTGKAAQYGDRVVVQFKQWIMNGKQIEDTYSSGGPVEYEIGGEGELIGMSEALMKMNEGEKAKIYIPYFLAFGEYSQASKIPPYANIIMELELIQILPQ